MKRSFYLLLSFLVAFTAVFGVLTLYDTQTVQAAPVGNLPAAPVEFGPIQAPAYQVTATQTITFYLGEGGEIELDPPPGCDNTFGVWNESHAGAHVDTEAQLVGLLIERVAYWNDDDEHYKVFVGPGVVRSVAPGGILTDTIFGTASTWANYDLYYETHGWSTPYVLITPNYIDDIDGHDPIWNTQLQDYVENMSGVPTVTLESTSWLASYEVIQPGEKLEFSVMESLFGATKCPGKFEDFRYWPVYYGVYTPTACTDLYFDGVPIIDTTVAGNDEDGNSHTLTTTNYYLLETAPGPWNDSYLDRYDAAVSFDRSTWTPLLDWEITSCVSETLPGYSSVYFRPISETFYIRVNDEDGQFADNSGSLSYSISDVSCPTCGPGIPNCEDSFTKGDLLLQMDYEASNQSGFDFGLPEYGWSDNPLLAGVPRYRFEPDQWYAVETVSPPFYYGDGLFMGGKGDISDDFGNLVPTWTPLDDFGACVVEYETGYQRVYFLTEDTEYGIRAHVDQSGLIGGDLNVNLYGATFTPPPSPCESKYSLSLWRESAAIYADRPNGYPLPRQFTFSHGWWALTTILGPWYEDLGTSPQYEIEISDDSGATWRELTEYEGAQCVAEPTYNHDRIYFYVPEEKVDTFMVRVHDQDGGGSSDFGDNTGSISYELHQVSLLLDPDELCQGFTKGDLLVNDSVDASIAFGTELPPVNYGYLEKDQWYALETTGDPWNNGTSDVYSAGLAIKTLGAVPTIFYPLESYPGGCSIRDGNYTTLYFKSGFQTPYQYRAEDPGSYGDNTGQSSYKLYETTYEFEPPPPCSDNYNIVEPPVSEGPIISQLENGVSVSNVDAGELMYLAISGGPWHEVVAENRFPYYDVEISDDGGQTWGPLDEYSDIECVTYDVGDVPRIFFAASDGEYRLRVENQTGDWPTTNQGEMYYKLHSTVIDSSLPPIIIGPEPGEGDACFSICLRPSLPIWSGWSEMGEYFGGWSSYLAGYIEYARCSFSKYIAWCPEHTAVMQSLEYLFIGKEPYGAIMEFFDVWEAIQAEINGYEWVPPPEGGGGTSQDLDAIQSGDYETPVLTSPENFILVPKEGGGAMEAQGIEYLPWETDNIWSGGEWSLIPENSTPYSTTCQNALVDTLGTVLSPAVCFVFNILDNVGLMTWYQWTFDVGMLMVLGYYVKIRWIDGGWFA